MKKLITLFAVLGMVLALAPAAQAAPVTNPASFNPVPLGNYRLMFVTTATTTGSSTDLAGVYNPIAQTAGNDVLLGHTWTALVGSSTVSARTNTGAYVVGDGGLYSAAIDVPIYTTNGTRIADNNAALWAGAGKDGNQTADQLGVTPGFSNDSAWGGWLAGGDIIPAASGSNFSGPMGETVGNTSSFRTYKEPWDFGSFTQSTTLPLVSLSGVIGSGTTPAADPEITSITWGSPNVTIDMTGEDGTTYTCDSSTDLVSWDLNVATSAPIVPVGGVFSFTTAAGDPKKFYRIAD
jgi:hypothetical protein